MTRIQYATAPVQICAAQRSFPNPPTEDGADVEGWTDNQGRAQPRVFLTIMAGGSVSIAAGAVVVAEELHDTYPEETDAVTCTNATETVNLAAHGFYTGDGPVWLSADVIPTGYTANVDYYVIRTGSGTMKLAASRADALAGTAVAITTDGTNVVLHWVTGTKSTSQNASAHDGTANTFTIAGHGIATGTRVQVANSGGALPTGLAADTDYYAIAASSSLIKFATSAENAAAGTAVDFDGDGTGTQSVISDERGPTEETQFVAFDDINDGYAFDLTADIALHWEFPHRPGALAYHLVMMLDSPVPITAHVRQIEELDAFSS